MTAEIADVADIDGEVVSGLPLNVKSLVHRVRERIGAIIGGEREQREATLDFGRIRQMKGCRIAGRRNGRRRTKRILEGAIGVEKGVTERRIHVRRRLDDAERATRDLSRCDTRRKIREKFTAVVIQAPARADHELPPSASDAA